MLRICTKKFSNTTKIKKKVSIYLDNPEFNQKQINSWLNYKKDKKSIKPTNNK